MTRPPDLLLSFDFPPMGGGIARWMSEMARRYPPGELLVSTGAMPESEAADRELPNPVDRVGVSASRLKTLAGLVQWSRRVTSLVAAHHPGFVWCGNLRPAAYPAKWAYERTGVPYGVIVHGGDLLALRRNYLDSRVKRAAARTLLGTAEVLVACSRWTHDLACDVLRELGLPDRTSRVRVVPLGTDPERFRPGLDPGPLLRSRGLAGGPWILTVARLVSHKGIDTTIRALRQLAPVYPELRYAVVGQGTEHSALLQLARDEGVADRVHLLGGLGDAELPLAYAMASVYSGVSRQTERDVEGFGISLLEAQSSGVPVVAGRSGGIPDAVKDGETGLLADPEDPVAVAAALKMILEDRPRGAAMGRAGRAAVERYFNWNRVIADLRAISAEARFVPP